MDKMTGFSDFIPMEELTGMYGELDGEDIIWDRGLTYPSQQDMNSLSLAEEVSRIGSIEYNMGQYGNSGNNGLIQPMANVQNPTGQSRTGRRRTDQSGNVRHQMDQPANTPGRMGQSGNSRRRTDQSETSRRRASQSFTAPSFMGFHVNSNPTVTGQYSQYDLGYNGGNLSPTDPMPRARPDFVTERSEEMAGSSNWTRGVE
ncbi:uncharacterized protein LOC122267035 [Penaeus japonicus]|uniref:uncharacterized protein LOC122267035 n=1 Tax=Penaeus japonicus TaxID=27405 RepID=UPI001C7172D5|nr:uncharacterized protein LOC122267035 [Penaeus japonicus]